MFATVNCNVGERRECVFDWMTGRFVFLSYVVHVRLPGERLRGLRRLRLGYAETLGLFGWPFGVDMVLDAYSVMLHKSR